MNRTDERIDQMAEWPWPDAPADEERIVRFRPAFHGCRDKRGDLGIGSVHMVWVLRIGDRALTWDTFTGWELPNEAFVAAAPGCTHPLHLLGDELFELLRIDGDQAVWMRMRQLLEDA